MKTKFPSKPKSIYAPSSSNESVSVRVEKISNGYLIHKSHSTDDHYSSTTTYSKSKPDIDIGSKGSK